MNVLVSACLLGNPCRYDGRSKPCDGVISLRKKVQFVPMCPEVLGRKSKDGETSSFGNQFYERRRQQHCADQSSNEAVDFKHITGGNGDVDRHEVVAGIGNKRKDDEGVTVLGQQIQYLRAKHDEDDLQHAYTDHDRQSRHDAVD